MPVATDIMRTARWKLSGSSWLNQMAWYSSDSYSTAASKVWLQSSNQSKRKQKPNLAVWFQENFVASIAAEGQKPWRTVKVKWILSYFTGHYSLRKHIRYNERTCSRHLIKWMRMRLVPVSHFVVRLENVFFRPSTFSWNLWLIIVGIKLPAGQTCGKSEEPINLRGRNHNKTLKTAFVAFASAGWLIVSRVSSVLTWTYEDYKYSCTA